MMRQRETTLWLLAAVLALMAPAVLPVAQPAVLNAAEPAAFKLQLRKMWRGKDGSWSQVTTPEAWAPQQTAVIVCDMWDMHHCRNATLRVGEIAPHMDKVIAEMRSRGALVVHAPSSCMEHYQNHPARKRAQGIAKADNLPATITQWCKQIPGEEMSAYPIDQSDGGEDDDLELHAQWAAALKKMGRNPRSPWKRQTAAIAIDPERDLISDRGDEIWNALQQRGVKNVVLLGVHTNMCVLGRPFGLRQMAQNGMNVVLMRDMTDTMYNPARRPYVSHYRGTDLIIEHIEKYVAPTITSDQVVAGKPFKFKWDKPTRVVVAIAEPEYQTWETLPRLAKKIWTKQRGYLLTVLTGDPKKHTVSGLTAALKNADVLVLSIRRQALPADQLDAIRAHLKAGKPLLAIRTSSHAFDARGKGPEGHAEWPDFDPQVLGGNYTGHHANNVITTVTAAEDAATHAILKGVKLPFDSGGSLYKAKPLASTATPLLYGTTKGKAPEPVAWTNRYGKAKVFYTSLGHTSDFKQPAFEKLMWNAMEWVRTLPSDAPETSNLLPGARQ